MSALGLQGGRQAIATATSAVQRAVFSPGVLMADSGQWRAYESATREALGQFWQMKASDWNNSTPDEQIQWTLLDAEVHKIWARLEDQLQWADDNSNIEAHGRARAEALAKAENLYKLAGNMTAAGRVSKMAAAVKTDTAQARRESIDASYGAAFAEQAGKLFSGSILGVPTWAWAAGGAGLLLLLIMRDR